jgi:ribosomal protein S18 acetylase RimI-like enzyme
MKITEFTQTDRPEVVRLWTRCNLVAPQNDPDKDIDRKMKKDPDLFLVGKLKERIVASVMGGYEGHRGWINYLAVDPDFRKIGYGKQMMKEIENRLKALGCPKINLQVRETNISVIKFYEAIGFSNDHVIGLGKRVDFN